ncbi:hypothetical protein QWI17_14680 [Gilvimarinus sp. SDUM040013]|nr:hypothetical protein [Gilvimarinus sp. SDUM040013]MDO3387089.1 hypothetical protein [Gilvimarinus sp. SDUM040013]
MTHNKAVLLYHDSNTELKVGDRIKVKKLFGHKLATVVYVPGQSKFHKDFGDDNWVIQYDNEKYDVRFLPFYPDYEQHIPKKYVFVSRGGRELEVSSDEKIE